MSITFTRQVVTTGTGSVNIINNNFSAIQTALANAVSRSGTSPNYMNTLLDMNSNRIVNLPAATSNTEPVTYAQFVAAQGDLLYTGEIAASAVIFTPTGTGAVELDVQAELVSKAKTVTHFGATGDGVTDDTVAVQAALAAVEGTGRTLEFPYGTYLLTSQILIHQCKVIGDNAKLKFSGLSSSTDCVVLQGSRSDIPLHFKGFYIDCNSCGRDGIVLAGGKSGATQADMLRMDNVLVDSPIRDGIHIEPSATFHWIEDFNFSDVRVTDSGRHGIAIIQPNLSTTFINQGTFINCEVRGAGQTTAGSYDVYVEGQGTVSGQKVSEMTWINCEFDASSAANHGSASFYLNETGSESDFDGWVWLGCTFEDVGDGVPGKAYAIAIGATATVRNPQVIGGVMANYTGVMDYTKVTSGRVAMSSSNINFDMLATGTKLRWGNGATDTIEWEEAGYLKTTSSLKATSGIREGRTALTNSAGAITVVRGFNKLNLTANVTSITFPTGTADNLDGQLVRIQFTQDATGGRTVAGWPAAVLLSGGSFTPTATASKTSHIEFIYERGEAKWYEVSRSLNI